MCGAGRCPHAVHSGAATGSPLIRHASQEGDEVLLYQMVKQGSKEQPGVTGLCSVARAPYEDPGAGWGRGGGLALDWIGQSSMRQRMELRQRANSLGCACIASRARCSAPAAAPPLLLLRAAEDSKWLAFDLRLEEVRLQPAQRGAWGLKHT